MCRFFISKFPGRLFLGGAELLRVWSSCSAGMGVSQGFCDPECDTENQRIFSLPQVPPGAHMQKGNNNALKGIDFLLENYPNAMTDIYLYILFYQKCMLNWIIDFKGANENNLFFSFVLNHALCLELSKWLQGDVPLDKITGWHLIPLEEVHPWGWPQNILLKENPEIHRHLSGNKTCWFLLVIKLIWKYFISESWR